MVQSTVRDTTDLVVNGIKTENSNPNRLLHGILSQQQQQQQQQQHHQQHHASQMQNAYIRHPQQPYSTATNSNPGEVFFYLLI